MWPWHLSGTPSQLLIVNVCFILAMAKHFDNSLHALYHLVYITTLQRRFYYYHHHFRDEKAKARKGTWLNKWQGSNLNSDLPMLINSMWNSPFCPSQCHYRVKEKLWPCVFNWLSLFLRGHIQRLLYNHWLQYTESNQKCGKVGKSGSFGVIPDFLLFCDEVLYFIR